MLWFCLLAALPPDEAEGLAADATPAGWSTVTYALQRPPAETDEAVLLQRLPAWDAAFGFTRYAIPLATPTAGGDVAAQLERFGRLSALVGAARLVAITPTVGTAGWETSHNLAWMPLGGRPSLVATDRDRWLAALGEMAAGTIALTLDHFAAEPTVEQLGEYLDAQLAACAAAKQQLEVWLPAAWADDEAPSPLLAALTPERVSACRRVVWLQVEVRLPQQALGAGEPEVTMPMPAAGGVEAVSTATPSPAADDEVTVQPTAMQASEKTAALLAALASRLPRGLAGVDLTDSPRRPLARVEATQEYLTAARRAGLLHLVVRGRLDTPQAPLWRELLAKQ